MWFCFSLRMLGPRMLFYGLKCHIFFPWTLIENDIRLPLMHECLVEVESEWMAISWKYMYYCNERTFTLMLQRQLHQSQEGLKKQHKHHKQTRLTTRRKKEPSSGQPKHKVTFDTEAKKERSFSVLWWFLRNHKKRRVNRHAGEKTVDNIISQMETKEVSSRDRPRIHCRSNQYNQGVSWKDSLSYFKAL